MDTAAHAEHGAPAAPLAVPAARNGSGTSWLPDASPMHALHGQTGPWSLMLHGIAHVQYIRQRSDRGGDQFGSINWVMGMATRPLAGGELGLRAMLSAEPWTIPGCGYPLLLATGELCEGEPIHDAQHPHDLFMELAGDFRRGISNRLGVQLYGALAGEPALGPVAFPHRPSAMTNPLAPISHHWLDATHIAFGVLTAGVYGRLWKAEASAFNGREPDEERTGIDLGRLDSFAGRLWLLPGERWAVQLSAGHLEEAEPGHEPGAGRVDVIRYTASATHHRPLTGVGTWASTAAAGRNVEEGEGTNALLVETTLQRGRDVLFARAEWAEKVGHDLDLADALEDAVFRVGQVSAGYTREFPVGDGLLGIGLHAAVSFVPDALEPYYGTPTPAGLTLSLDLRPRAMAMMDMGMEGMRHASGEGDQGAPAQGGGDQQGAAAGGAHAGHAEPAPGPGAAPGNHEELIHAIYGRMMADPVIRERVATDPVLQRLLSELQASMPTLRETGEAGDVAPSSPDLVSDFVLRLLSNPEVAARIQEDPHLQQLWSDPLVQRRLRELRRRR